MGEGGWEPGRNSSRSLSAPDRPKSPLGPELGEARNTWPRSPTAAQAGGPTGRYSLPRPPPPLPAAERSREVHAAGRAASAGRGAGRGADKSAAGAVSRGEGGERGRGGRPRRLAGDPREGVRDRARQRGGEVCAGCGPTRGPSLALSILRALSLPSLPTCLFLSDPVVRGTGSGNPTTGSWVFLPRPQPLITGFC